MVRPRLLLEGGPARYTPARLLFSVLSALDVLSQRERRVFEARRLADDPPSLEQLGRELFISSERVRQIEIVAFEKVKRAAVRRFRSVAPAPSKPPYIAFHLLKQS